MTSVPGYLFCTILLILSLVTCINADFITDFSSNLSDNNPDDALLLLGEHYPNATDALVFIDEYISDNPKNFGAYGIKGCILNDQNKYTEALEAFDKGVSLSGRDINFMSFFLAGRAHALYGLKQFSEALTRADLAIDNQKMNFYGGTHSLTEAYTIKGMSHFEKGEYSKALEAFLNAGKYSPNDQYIQMNTGNAYYLLGDYDKALEAYNTSLSIKPSLDSLYYKGLTLRKLKRYEEAIEMFRQALELNPDDEKIEEEISDTQRMAQADKK